MAFRDGFFGIGYEWDVGYKVGIGDARWELGFVDFEFFLVVFRGYGFFVNRLLGRYFAFFGGICNV